MPWGSCYLDVNVPENPGVFELEQQDAGSNYMPTMTRPVVWLVTQMGRLKAWLTDVYCLLMRMQGRISRLETVIDDMWDPAGNSHNVVNWRTYYGTGL